jgi:hypothetical protein
MNKPPNILEKRNRILETRLARPAPRPLTEAETRRAVTEEIRRLPVLRLELPVRRGGCCG